jgi:phage terminase large subunit-like protein
VSSLVIPELETKPWPTLGPQVCQFIETYLVHGPGDIRGDRAILDDETRGLIYRAYEVFPKKHARAGRRRFKRVGISLRKGTAKTEKAAWIAACELHPDAPVRCDGFDASGEPVGVGVRDPYIPMVAYTAEQTEDLAYGALYVILSEGPLADDFDIGYERIRRVRGDGVAQPLAGAPNARDGARTSFQHFDETHRFTLDTLRDAHKTMLGNMPKRPAADPWTLETTTAPAAGERSVAERTMDYAKSVARGEVKDSRLFFFHRGASDKHDLTTEEGVTAAILEASGPYAEWSDIPAILDLWRDPQMDPSYFERVWLNRIVQGGEKAFDPVRWRELAEPRSVPTGDLIVIGLDGARFRDTTAAVATHVESGYQWPLGIWERPPNAEQWELDVEDVDSVIRNAFEEWSVWRMYVDPQWLDPLPDRWAGRWGDRFQPWLTHRQRQVAFAIRGYTVAQRAGEMSHDGDETFATHIANARKRPTNLFDDEGQVLYLLTKARHDSPEKIDVAMAGVLSWEARGDCIAAGEDQAPGPSVVQFM